LENAAWTLGINSIGTRDAIDHADKIKTNIKSKISMPYIFAVPVRGVLMFETRRGKLHFHQEKPIRPKAKPWKCGDHPITVLVTKKPFGQNAWRPVGTEYDGDSKTALLSCAVKYVRWYWFKTGIKVTFATIAALPWGMFAFLYGAKREIDKEHKRRTKEWEERRAFEEAVEEAVDEERRRKRDRERADEAWRAELDRERAERGRERAEANLLAEEKRLFESPEENHQTSPK